MHAISNRVDIYRNMAIFGSFPLSKPKKPEAFIMHLNCVLYFIGEQKE